MKMIVTHIRAMSARKITAALCFLFLETNMAGLSVTLQESSWKAISRRKGTVQPLQFKLTFLIKIESFQGWFGKFCRVSQQKNCFGIFYIDRKEWSTVWMLFARNFRSKEWKICQNCTVSVTKKCREVMGLLLVLISVWWDGVCVGKSEEKGA